MKIPLYPITNSTNLNHMSVIRKTNTQRKNVAPQVYRLVRQTFTYLIIQFYLTRSYIRKLIRRYIHLNNKIRKINEIRVRPVLL